MPHRLRWDLAQVLIHVCTRLQLLHAAGWVHRDIKPGNILRRPRQHSWTLIDFGSTVREGTLTTTPAPALLPCSPGHLAACCSPFHGPVFLLRYVADAKGQAAACLLKACGDRGYAQA